MPNLHIIEGDITLATVDAIVNAADPMLLGGGGVDGAIHQAAGPTLLSECLKIKAVRKIRCPVGEARITAAGNLASRYVIHTVGPKYHREEQPQKLLAAAYRQSLSLALENNCQSIAFPAISCGAYGYPIREAAEVAIQTCLADEFKNIDILFYLYGQKNYSIWQSVLDKKNR
ncbi:O-acetyl-ADP-ribose deacetylase [Sinobacterium norvegicum]|uniref:O-acetyl-ADP-ribose deacetylase n=1 Tax=Sinobacterium norvegicum TaxID=1641715 RepID=A0ABM9AHZ1_9GAMM|nr:macro domain-containing protein [Sinobacterium norvegicum]CAH0992367.1 O-acetyl-ADP-ribose deacetylase [Sinobacterium norvegicum]